MTDTQQRTTSGLTLAPAKNQSASEPDGRVRPSTRTRRARLRISRVDPWSVMKTSFLFSIALGIMSTNPGMPHTRAVAIARRTVQRFPKVVE